MPEKSNKKGYKFITSIIIGGALGSMAAWVFGNKQRREKISEGVGRALHCDQVKKTKKKLFGKWFSSKED